MKHFIVFAESADLDKQKPAVEAKLDELDKKMSSE
jgi:hypothetical protein